MLRQDIYLYHMIYVQSAALPLGNEAWGEYSISRLLRGAICRPTHYHTLEGVKGGLLAHL